MKTEKTKVVFRVFMPDKESKDVIALFPEIASDYYGAECLSYMHVGQHSGADYEGLISITRLATPAEYKSLAKELRRIGYRLDIRKRCSHAMRNKRIQDARAA